MQTVRACHFPTVYLVFRPRYRVPDDDLRPESGDHHAGTLGRVSPRREDLGSWLEGTPGGEPDSGQFELPKEGPGSVARLGRRVVGIHIDWFASLAVSSVLFPVHDTETGVLLPGAPLATLGVFFVSTAVLVSLLGTSIGHRLVGIQVVRVRDLGVQPFRAPGPVAGVVRTVLLCLVVPAVMWTNDGRGLHDVAAGTVIVRR